MGMSKRAKLIREKVDAEKNYAPEEAFGLLKELSRVKFNETIDVAINLGIDPRKSDQVVRGSSVLPNGTGKTVRVAVFAQGEQAEAAKSAGADIVGFEDLAEQVKGGMMDFDVVIAAPDAMRVVGALGQVLGPRGLMPNPKVGTSHPMLQKLSPMLRAGRYVTALIKPASCTARLERLLLNRFSYEKICSICWVTWSKLNRHRLRVFICRR